MGAVAALEVLVPGPLTTVQDLGRFGFGRYGVAQSGALDAFSLRIGNLLVGNPEGEAVIEITLMGFRARALTDLAVAVTGGDLQPHVNDRPVRTWSSHLLHEGDLLSFKRLENGCRAYLALGGGILLPPVLESKSTNLSSGFGGLQGRPLRKGDVLSSGSPQRFLEAAGRVSDPEILPRYGRDWTLRVILGPQDEDFLPDVRQNFLSSSFQVSTHSDRTGIRLKGPQIQRRAGLSESIISEGVVPGTIQVPGDGQPIIILGETVTGGYRKIATVITADLPLLGQMKPGDSVCFRIVKVEEAVRILLEREEKIQAFKDSLLHKNKRTSR